MRPIGYWKKLRKESPYFASDKYKTSHRARVSRYGKNNRPKRNARLRLQRAIKAGEIVRPNHCVRCGVVCKPEAHHPDYDRPLEVQWVCKPCHYIVERIKKSRLG